MSFLDYERFLLLVVRLLIHGLLGVADLEGDAILHDAVNDGGGGHGVRALYPLQNAHLLGHQIRVLQILLAELCGQSAVNI